MDPMAIVAIGVMAVGAALVYRLAGGDRVKRALRATPPTAIRDVGDRTIATVSGIVEVGAPLLAGPLTGRRCVAWRVIVEERRGASWSEIVSEARAADFLLRDGTGKAHVSTKAVAMRLVDDAEFASGATREPTAVLEAFLDRHRQPARGAWLNRELRYREAVVIQGDRLVVRGNASWEPDPDPDPGAETGYRDPPARLSIAAAARTPVYVGDEAIVAA